MPTKTWACHPLVDLPRQCDSLHGLITVPSRRRVVPQRKSKGGSSETGILGGELLVDVDAESGCLVGVHVAVLGLGAAGEDGAGLGREDVALVDAEIVAGQLERELGGVRDRRGVAGAVPGGLHAEELAERRHLARRAQPADLRDVDADEVDQPAGDQRQVFLLRVEQLAHRDRHARLLPDEVEVVLLLGRQRVLDEERVVLLQLLAQADRLAGRDPLVDVVQQLDVVAEGRCAGARTASGRCAGTARAPRYPWGWSARSPRGWSARWPAGCRRSTGRGSRPGRGCAGTPWPSRRGRSPRPP